MKAVRIHTYGGLETLVYEEAPRPEPRASQVLIRVDAAGVNPLDWKIREGRMKTRLDLKMPVILGMDVSGVVEAVGASVTNFKPGQEVYGIVNHDLGGSYAEYALAEANEIVLKPKTIDHIGSASVPVVALTAWQALFDIGELSAGQTVLIHAAAGGIGHFAVQLAKWKGARVIGTASARNLDFVRSLGADEVIDYTATAFEKAISDVDVVLDSVGGDTQERSWSVLKPRGILVTTLFSPNPEITQETAAKHSCRFAMVVMQYKADQLREIAELIDNKQVKTIVEKVLPLNEARQAHELSQIGHTRGKIVLKIGS